MDIPNPLGAVYRVFIALRKNACTIEIVTNTSYTGSQYIRIRNDSDYPVKLYDICFRWRSIKSKKFDQFDTPLVWVLNDYTGHSLTPGEAIEHPVDAAEAVEAADRCEVSVIHNRSKFASKKNFKLKNP